MKKSLIAGASALALGIAAVPAAGVFATQTSAGTTTDTVEVTIDNECALTATGNSSAFSATMTNSQLKSDFGSTTMTIKCNNAAGWDLKAVGAGDDATDKTVMNAAVAGTDIATGTATSGATSNWAFKVAGDNAVSGYTSFSAVPSGETTVATSSVATDTTTGTTVTTTYQVWISPTQQADTYTGKVAYTLYQPHE